MAIDTLGSSWALTPLILSLHKFIASLSSSWLVCPFFQRAQMLPFLLSSSQSSLFSQDGLLSCQPIFQHIVMVCYCPYKIFSLKNVQILCTILLFRTVSQGTLSTSPLSRPKSVLWESKAAVLLTSLLDPWEPKTCNISRSACPRMHQAPYYPSVLCTQIQQGIFPSSSSTSCVIFPQAEKP